MDPYLSRHAAIQDVPTARYGWAYAGRRGKIVTVSRDPETGRVTNFFLRLDGEGKVLDLREDELRTID